MRAEVKSVLARSWLRTVPALSTLGSGPRRAPRPTADVVDGVRRAQAAPRVGRRFRGLAVDQVLAQCSDASTAVQHLARGTRSNPWSSGLRFRRT